MAVNDQVEDQVDDQVDDRVRRAPGPTVGVVVCTYTAERLPMLRAAVASVHAQEHHVDQLVVVVDGDEALGSIVRDALPGEQVVVLGRNRGVSVARNTGAAQLETDLVFFLDDDATAHPRWVAALAPYLTRPDVLGASARSVGDFDGRPPAWLPDEYLWTVGVAYRGLPEVAAPVRNFYGGCAGMRRDTFLEVGGFADGIGHGDGRVGGGEEAEFCLRVRAARPDGDFWFVPEARIDHRVPAPRATWAYLVRRSFDEGVMKGDIARALGEGPAGGEALGPEREFARRLPQAALGYLRTPGRRSAALGTVVASLAVVAGLVRSRLSRRPVVVVRAGEARA